MIWTAVFTVSIAQGIFLLALLIRRSSGNRLATRFLAAVILVMVLDQPRFCSRVVRVVSIGPSTLRYLVRIIFLLGPLFYFYARSITDRQFSWKGRHYLHFVPYLLEVLMNLSFMSLSPPCEGRLHRSVCRRESEGQGD